MLILAGAPAGPELSPGDPKLSRAMIPLGEKTMLQWVVDALRASPSIGRILAVGSVSADGLDQVLEPTGDLVGNLKLGMDALGPCDAALVVCSDIPMLTPAAVEDFIARAVDMDADMAYPIISKADCEATHPELQRTYLKTGDGVFTGGNIMLLRPDFMSRNWDAIEKAYAARKQTGKLARMIGIGVLFRMLLAQLLPCVLKVSALEQAVSRMLGGKVAAVVSAYPEIGEDVDKPSDLAAVLTLMRRDSELRPREGENE